MTVSYLHNMNVIFICAAVADESDEALASQIHVAVRCWWFPRSTQSEHWRCFPRDLATFRRFFGCRQMSTMLDHVSPFPLGSSEEKQTKLADMALMSYAGDQNVESTSQGDITGVTVGRNLTWIKSISVCALSPQWCAKTLWSEVKIIAEINKLGAQARLSYYS